MRPEPRTVQRVYLVLMLFNTLAASFIWGINTLFLLDAGLSPTAAFTPNALFTAGLADGGPVLGLGGDLGPARPGLHLLLRGHRGLAGRRPQVHRVQGEPRVR